MSNIDLEKFSKYSKPGPRYTSYPTALEFNDSFTYDTYIKHLEEGTEKISLYIHLPFCRSACYFCGCNVVFTSKEEKLSTYIEYLKKEIDILVSHLDVSREVIQFHFGGGTPTFYKAHELDEIVSYVKSKFPNWSNEAEISCEIDPRFFNEDQMKVFQKHGFNRISFGVQDFDPKVQKEIHRIQPYDITKAAVDLARKYGIGSINVDLIYGLPYQTFESFKKTLEEAFTLNPNRLAVFNYAHVPWLKKTMRKFDETTLPSPEVKLNIFQYTIEFFEGNGYKMVGMDHFAKPDDELAIAQAEGSLHRNFQGYTTHAECDLIAMGVSSISSIHNSYSQNEKDLDGYYAAINAGKLPLIRGLSLTDDDVLRREVIQQLSCHFKLDFTEIEEQYDVQFKDYFSTELEELQLMQDDDLLTVSKNEIQVSAKGRMLIRNICMVFDEHLRRQTITQSFSKVI